MVQLFEQDIKTNDRQSSKGNQLKWCRTAIRYTDGLSDGRKHK